MDENALHYAAVGGHLGVMKYFIERGYNPASEATDGRTCLHVKIVKDGLVFMLQHDATTTT